MFKAPRPSSNQNCASLRLNKVPICKMMQREQNFELRSMKASIISPKSAFLFYCIFILNVCSLFQKEWICRSIYFVNINSEIVIHWICIQVKTTTTWKKHTLKADYHMSSAWVICRIITFPKWVISQRHRGAFEWLRDWPSLENWSSWKFNAERAPRRLFLNHIPPKPVTKSLCYQIKMTKCYTPIILHSSKSNPTINRCFARVHGCGKSFLCHLAWLC